MYLWSPYGTGKTIIFSSCRLFVFFLLFPRLIAAIAEWMSAIIIIIIIIMCTFVWCKIKILRCAKKSSDAPYLHTWCSLSANLRCRYETCCTRLAENTGHKKITKKSPSGHHRTTLSGYIFATKAHIDNRKKKLVKLQYVLHMSS